MENERLQSALEYSELGYSVIPLIRGMKKPPKGVTWVNRRFNSPDECSDKEWKAVHPDVEWGPAGKEQLKQWFGVEHPTANVGILTGAISGIDAIDEEGPHAHETLVAQSGIDPPETVTSVTGRDDGGKQRIFQYHGGGLKSTARFCHNDNGSQCDIRTDGGLIVVHPSIHKSGKRYEWEVDPRIEDPAPFPPALVKFIHERQSEGKTSNKDGTTVKVDYEEYFKNGIPDGAKHHGLFNFACKKISQGLPYPEVLCLTTEVARRSDPPPKDGAEKAAKDRVDQAWAKHGPDGDAAPDESEWDEPADLTRRIPSAPEFPLQALPSAVRGYVTDNVTRLQCPTGMVALSGVGDLAALIGKDVVIRPKASDTEWEERSCLWIQIVSAKSSMKSAAIKAGTKQSKRIQQILAGEDKEIKKKWVKQNAELQMRKKAYEKKCSKILKDDTEAQLPPLPEDLEDPPEEPISRRIVVNDTTIEKLADLMEVSRGLTLNRDELSGFMLNMSRYNNGSDRQFYLECYSGGSYHIDRISRGEQYIGDLYMNIIGGIQPKIARKIFSGEDNG